MILLLKKEGNYYPQVFLKECNYNGKEKNVIRYLPDNSDKGGEKRIINNVFLRKQILRTLFYCEYCKTSVNSCFLQVNFNLNDCFLVYSSLIGM